MFSSLLSSIRKDWLHHVKSLLFVGLIVFGITVLNHNVKYSVFEAAVVVTTVLFALHDLHNARVRPSAVLYDLAFGLLMAWLPRHHITAVSYYVIVGAGAILLNHFRRIPTGTSFAHLRREMHHVDHIVVIFLIFVIGILVMGPSGVPASTYVVTVLAVTAFVAIHGLVKKVAKSSLAYTVAYGGLLAGLPFIFGGPLPLICAGAMFGAVLVHHRLVIAAHRRDRPIDLI